MSRVAQLRGSLQPQLKGGLWSGLWHRLEHRELCETGMGLGEDSLPRLCQCLGSVRAASKEASEDAGGWSVCVSSGTS